MADWQMPLPSPWKVTPRLSLGGRYSLRKVPLEMCQSLGDNRIWPLTVCGSTKPHVTPPPLPDGGNSLSPALTSCLSKQKCTLKMKTEPRVAIHGSRKLGEERLLGGILYRPQCTQVTFSVALIAVHADPSCLLETVGIILLFPCCTGNGHWAVDRVIFE
ncbi:hypothetical protein P7K49_020588 [Saguinus oedipus]|uniref:Uncharacterized protein n=1 Tax=Saguinus oedipus TaxID=9490 RepID=A0ABQ9V1D8_SAGOE|nr:hypothetical protein P7K49_020588 [Saguinus oedipus]